MIPGTRVLGSLAAVATLPIWWLFSSGPVRVLGVFAIVALAAAVAASRPWGMAISATILACLTAGVAAGLHSVTLWAIAGLLVGALELGLRRGPDLPAARARGALLLIGLGAAASFTVVWAPLREATEGIAGTAGAIGLLGAGVALLWAMLVAVGTPT